MASVLMNEFASVTSKSGFGGIFTAVPTSVNSSAIIDGTITTADISNEAITAEKFAPEVQAQLATFTYNLNNLMFPGWYGTFTIKNNNASNPETFTFTVEEQCYNSVTDTTDVRSLLGSTTLAHNAEQIITLGIHERLTNGESIIKINYTLSDGTIDSTSETGIDIESETESYYEFEVQPTFIHNGNIAFEVTIVV